jgi:hypothetical protein
MIKTAQTRRAKSTVNALASPFFCVKTRKKNAKQKKLSAHQFSGIYQGFLCEK